MGVLKGMTCPPLTAVFGKASVTIGSNIKPTGDFWKGVPDLA